MAVSTPALSWRKLLGSRRVRGEQHDSQARCILLLLVFPGIPSVHTASDTPPERGKDCS